MKIYLAGVIQGSNTGKGIHDQAYRTQLKQIIAARYPDAGIVCPLELCPDSMSYSWEQGRQAFLSLVEEAVQADIVLAYLPHASMGTAVEMWAAHWAGKPVLTITPMCENWVVNSISDIVFGSIEEFEGFVCGGGFDEILSQVRRSAC
ncbi:MAG: hypothetical protein M1136_09505 [Chloroflexi bacterium]|nr:hypothetical protein [Chloroflexota bacterium]MCL5075863.1 hypothetical protein [Chloroflexota bacterium]